MKAQKFTHENIGDYTTWDDIIEAHSEAEVNSFKGFMSGQTVCGVPGDSTRTAIYYWDYERWLNKNKPSENDGWD